MLEIHCHLLHTYFALQELRSYLLCSSQENDSDNLSRLLSDLETEVFNKAGNNSCVQTSITDYFQYFFTLQRCFDLFIEIIKFKSFNFHHVRAYVGT